MKKLVLLISLCFVLVLSVPCFAFAADGELVVDNADLLTDMQETDLRTSLQEISAKHNVDVVVVTTNTLDGKTPEAYADDYYDYNGYKDDGCLFLVSMEDRDWHISTKGYGITAITDYGIGALADEVVPSLSNGNYYYAFLHYGSVVDDFFTEAETAQPYDTNHLYTNSNGITYGDDASSDSEDKGTAVLISLVVAVIIAFVIMKMVKSSYKPVRMNYSAANYLVDNSLNVTQSYEHFLYSTVSKTRRESSSGSGGGSSTHSSSSGSSHGGGGGKF